MCRFRALAGGAQSGALDTTVLRVHEACEQRVCDRMTPVVDAAKKREGRTADWQASGMALTLTAWLRIAVHESIWCLIAANRPISS